MLSWINLSEWPMSSIDRLEPQNMAYCTTDVGVLKTTPRTPYLTHY